MGAPAPPRAEKKFFSGLIYRKKCVSGSALPQDTKCTPQPEQESILGVLLGGLDLEVYLDGDD